MKQAKINNFKTAFAEKLFDSEIPSELILWALSNLPDTNQKGNFKTKIKAFNHEQENVLDALQINETILLNTLQKISSIMLNKGKTSESIEATIKFLNKASEEELKCIVLDYLTKTERIMEDILIKQEFENVLKRLGKI